jgi:hypothetical protein
MADEWAAFRTGATAEGTDPWAEFKPPKPDVAEDIAKSGSAGFESGAATLLGLPGDITNLGAKGIGAASNVISDVLGIDRYNPQQKTLSGLITGEQPKPTMGPIASALSKIPTAETMQKEMQTRYHGGEEPYKPQTTPGKYAYSVSEAVPGAVVGPGGLLMKGAQAAGTGIGSEAAAEYFHGTPLEPYAKFVGGFAGGVGTAAGSKAVEGFRNFNAGVSTGQEIAKTIGGSDLKPGAVRRVAGDLANEGLTPQAVQAKTAALGPEARLLDMGDQLAGRADRMAQYSGKAQNTIVKPVEERAAGAADTLNAVLDKHMGPPRDVVKLQNAIDDWSKKNIGPAYKDIESRYPVLNDQGLKDLATRPAIKTAMDRAEGVAANYGEKVSGAQPSLRYWDYVKKSIDQRINAMMKTGQDDLSSAQKADLGGLISAKQALVRHLDNLTGGEYAQVRKLAATKPQMEDAVEFGRSMFGNKLLPEQVTAHFNDLSLAEQQMVRIGARREIERAVNTPGDEGRKLRSMLGGGNNQEKLRGILGNTAQSEISNQVEAANQFQQMANKLKGSQTAQRLSGMADTNAPTYSPGTTAYGALMSIPHKGINYALEQGMANTRQDISRILTAKGPQINPVVEALMRYNQKRTANAATAAPEQMKTMIRALISGSGGSQ